MKEKARIELKVSNFFCRQGCFICGNGERQNGIEMSLTTPDNRNSFICPLCQEDYEGIEVRDNLPKVVIKWPAMLKKRAAILKTEAAYLEKVAEMEFILPTNAEWDKAINERAEWDKAIEEAS